MSDQAMMILTLVFVVLIVGGLVLYIGFSKGETATADLPAGGRAEFPLIEEPAQAVQHLATTQTIERHAAAPANQPVRVAMGPIIWAIVIGNLVTGAIAALLWALVHS